MEGAHAPDLTHAPGQVFSKIDLRARAFDLPEWLEGPVDVACSHWLVLVLWAGIVSLILLIGVVRAIKRGGLLSATPDPHVLTVVTLVFVIVLSVHVALCLLFHPGHLFYDAGGKLCCHGNYICEIALALSYVVFCKVYELLVRVFPKLVIGNRGLTNHVGAAPPTDDDDGSPPDPQLPPNTNPSAPSTTPPAPSLPPAPAPRSPSTPANPPTPPAPTPNPPAPKSGKPMPKKGNKQNRRGK